MLKNYYIINESILLLDVKYKQSNFFLNVLDNIFRTEHTSTLQY